MNKGILALFGLLAFVLTLSAAAPRAEGELGGDMGDMRNAFEYLQQLDKYYSQAARPRPERERREDVASALMKLSQIRQHYSDVGRPRFGKRSGYNFPGNSNGEGFLPSSLYRWK